MNGVKKIVVIDDEEDILELLDYNLTRNGYKVILRTDGTNGLKAIRDYRPDLIILDLMLPGLDGLDICRIVKNDKDLVHIPVVMLTVRGEEEDIITGLELGADDYITKPFSIHIFMARVKAVMRRSLINRSDAAKKSIFIGKLRIEPELRNVTVDEREVNLTPTEYGILKTLAENEDKVFTRKQLLSYVQGGTNSVTDRTIDVHLASLRKKLGEAGFLIETVRGVGYRFKSEYEKK